MSDDTIILQLCFYHTKLTYTGTSSLSLLNTLPAERRAAPGRDTPQAAGWLAIESKWAFTLGNMVCTAALSSVSLRGIPFGRTDSH